MQQFVGASSDEARGLLQDRWREIDQPDLIALRDKILTFTPTSIVTYEREAFLELRLPSANPDIIGSVWLVAPPIDRGIIRKRLVEAGFADHETLQQFLESFAGLREEAGVAGNFVGNEMLQEALCLFNEDWQLNPETASWKDSLMLFNARNGNTVLVHPNGKVGWWYFAEHDTAKEADNFEDFLIHFTDYLGTEYPYDGCGPE